MTERNYVHERELRYLINDLDVLCRVLRNAKKTTGQCELLWAEKAVSRAADYLADHLAAIEEGRGEG